MPQKRRENLRSINYLWMKTSLIRVVFHNLDSTIRQPHLYLTKECCGVFVVNIAIKGQLISKCPFGVFILTKIPTIFLWISALASNKRLNEKYIKALYFF